MNSPQRYIKENLKTISGHIVDATMKVHSTLGPGLLNVLRDSLRMYVHSADEQREFFESVEQGWYELHSGLGFVVAENDTFFDSIRKELRDLKIPTKRSLEHQVRNGL